MNCQADFQYIYSEEISMTQQEYEQRKSDLEARRSYLFKIKTESAPLLDMAKWQAAWQELQRDMADFLKDEQERDV